MQSLVIKKEVFIELCDGNNFSNLYQNNALKETFKHEDRQIPFRVATVFGNQSYYIYPTYAWAYGLETADGYLTLYSKRYRDFWAFVNFKRAEDTDTYNKLYLYPAKDISCQKELIFQNYYSLDLLSLANVYYFISSQPLKDGNLRLVPNPLLEEQLVWKDRPRRDKFLGLLSGAYPGAPVYVYENSNVLPRFFLTVKTTIFDDSKELLLALANVSVKDLRESAFVNRCDVLRLPPMHGVQGTKSGRVVLVRYTSDSIVLDVESDTEGVLVATNNFSPFWKAWVDNRETKIFPVYHTFQGIFLEKGHHRVDLKYNPPYSDGILKLFRQIL